MVCLVVCFTTIKTSFILKNTCCMYYWKFLVPYFSNKTKGNIFFKAWSAWKHVSFTNYIVWLWAIKIGFNWDGPVLVWTNHLGPVFTFQKPRFWKLMCPFQILIGILNNCDWIPSHKQRGPIVLDSIRTIKTTIMDIKRDVFTLLDIISVF